MSGCSNPFAYTEDSTSPDTQIDTSPPSPSRDSDRRLHLLLDRRRGAPSSAASTPGPFGLCSSPHATAVLADGPHTFEARAIDAAGNIDLSPASHTWTVDTIAPRGALDHRHLSRLARERQHARGQGHRRRGRLDRNALRRPRLHRRGRRLWFSRRLQRRHGNHGHRGRRSDHRPALHCHRSGRQRLHLLDPLRLHRGLDDPGAAASAAATEPGNDDHQEAEAQDEQEEGEVRVRVECTPARASRASSTPSPSAPCSSPKTYKKLRRGKHTFQVQATNPAGKSDATPATATWKVKKKVKR